MFGNVFNMSVMSFPAFLPTAQNLLTVSRQNDFCGLCSQVFIFPSTYLSLV